MNYELNSIEVAKILSKFNAKNIKLSFDDPKDINIVFNEIFPIFLQAYNRTQKSNCNSKCHELSCSRIKKSGLVLFYQYANLLSLGDKNHLDNMKTIHNLMPYISYYKQLPVVDMNGIFGVDLSEDENYLNGYYYSVVPYLLHQFPVEQQSKFLQDIKLCPIWHDYVLSYSLQDKQIYLSYLGFNDKKIFSKMGYSVLIKDFIELSKFKYKKFDNVINFLKNEKQFYDETYEECGLQFSSSLTPSLQEKHFGLELTPFPKQNGHPRDFYLDFLNEYFSKMIEYELLSSSQKDFILKHDTTIKNKDGVLKFRWANQETYEIKWYNIENTRGLTGG